MHRWSFVHCIWLFSTKLRLGRFILGYGGKAALAAGDNVVATGRKVETLRTLTYRTSSPTALFALDTALTANGGMFIPSTRTV